MANEIELKLHIAKSNAALFKREIAALAQKSTELTISQAISQHMVSVYYDTPTLTLLDNGITLRLRRVGDKWIQTLKGKGAVQSGLHQRIELESEVPQNQLDFSKIKDAEYQALLSDQTLRDALIPIFSTDINRTQWQLRYDNDDAIELVLDIGQVLSKDHQTPISEIELECVHGHIGRLFELGLQLQKNIPLSIENVSKAQRGYQFYRPFSPNIVKADQVKYSRKTSTTSAFKAIIWAYLSQLQGNQAMVLLGEDIEGVHQMRVALRRLQSALTVFSPIIHQTNCKSMMNELSWISHVLGHARDLDVFIHQTLPPLLSAMPAQTSLIQLAKKAETERAFAYKTVRNAIQSQRYQQLLLSIGDWLENERWLLEPSYVQIPVIDLANTVLSKQYTKLKKDGRKLSKMSSEQRHAVRISAKKLRYAAEFFISLYKTKSSAQFMNRLAALQERLGIMNDIAVTQQLVNTLNGARSSMIMTQAESLIIGWNTHKSIENMPMIDAAWQDFLAQKPFWQRVKQTKK